MRKRKKLTPWQKIIHACDSERGCRLTAEDCYKLGFDDAIRTRARLDDEGKDSDQDTTDDRTRGIYRNYSPGYSVPGPFGGHDGRR